MSDCEGIAKVAHIKRATVSESLRPLMTNGQMSNSLNNFWLKNEILFFSMFYIHFFMSEWLISSFLMSDVSESLSLLTKKEQWEQIPQVVHQKRATMSDSLRSLRGNE